MGEIADAMIEGTLCESCGEYLGEGPGYPRHCAGCEIPVVVNRGRKRELDGQSALPRHNRYSIPPEAGTVDCPYCASHPKLVGLADHIRAKHPEKIKGATP